MNKQTNQAYDLIGDIHGQHDKLVAILDTLGYSPRGEFSGWIHPEGRRVIFLGDYIDRGPKVREVLLEVRGMVDAGDALAIMGNHEYNAILFHLPDGQGGYLRPRTDKNVEQHSKTVAAFAGLGEEWSGWIEWMKGLPMFLDLGGLRVVHACWDGKRIGWLKSQALNSESFLRDSAVKQSQAHCAIENVLKGPELSLPEGVVFYDKDNEARNSIRSRWWDLPAVDTLADVLCLPEPLGCAAEIPSYEIRRVPNYGPDEPPVFFGHYWMPPAKPKVPLAPNLACLDFSGGIGDAPLVAYRWDGERILSATKFVF